MMDLITLYLTAVARANLMLAANTFPYVLGAGGRDPTQGTPLTTRPDTGHTVPGCDCIGFVAWCWGVDRYQKAFPRYDGWINVDSLLLSAASDDGWAELIDGPEVGCAVAYPSVWLDGHMERMGHIGLVLTTSEYGPWASSVVHCNAASRPGALAANSAHLWERAGITTPSYAAHWVRPGPKLLAMHMVPG